MEINFDKRFQSWISEWQFGWASLTGVIIFYWFSIMGIFVWVFNLSRCTPRRTHLTYLEGKYRWSSQGPVRVSGWRLCLHVTKICVKSIDIIIPGIEWKLQWTPIIKPIVCTLCVFPVFLLKAYISYLLGKIITIGIVVHFQVSVRLPKMTLGQMAYSNPSSRIIIVAFLLKLPLSLFNDKSPVIPKIAYG